MTEDEMQALIDAKIDAFDYENPNIQFYVAHYVLGDSNSDLGMIQSAIKETEAGEYVAWDELGEGEYELALAFLRELETLWLNWYKEKASN